MSKFLSHFHITLALAFIIGVFTYSQSLDIKQIFAEISLTTSDSTTTTDKHITPEPPVEVVQATSANTIVSTPPTQEGLKIFKLDSPRSFVAVAGACNSGSIILSWQPSEGATSYRLLRNNIKMYEGRDVTFTDRELAKDIDYTYVLFAFNSSAYAEPVTVKQKSPKACEIVPVQQAVTATGAQSVQPVAGVVARPASTTVSVPVTNVPVRTEPLPLPPVELKESVKNTVQSTEAITTTTVFKLKAPTSLSANRGLCGSTAMRLSWQPSEGATSYRLLRNNVKVYEGQDISFFDSNVALDTEYVYSVTAHYSYVSSEPLYVKVRSPKACEVIDEGMIIIKNPTTATTSKPREIVKPREATSTVAGQSIEQKEPKESKELKPKPAPEIISVGTQVQNLGTALETVKTVIDNSRDEVRKIIDIRVTTALKGLNPEQVAVITEEVQSRRNKLIDELDRDLKDPALLNTDRVTVIKTKIDKGIAEIDALIAEKFAQAPKVDVPDTLKIDGDIKNTLSTLVAETEKSSKLLKEQGADLLYKDTNKDGISDYESVHVYHIDPVAPSPVTEYQGKKITAGEKIILGLDPSKSEVVKVIPEEPKSSLAPLATSYKVDKVSLSEEKKVVLKGTALPNSFVTIYIYSTPVIVTVKTDKDGEWHYVMDKELESGEHTVYTATVNNTGKILAQSSGFQFVKTAEAATLGSLPSIQTTSEVQKPGLFNSDILMTIAIMFLIIIIASLIAVGIYTKNTNG